MAISLLNAGPSTVVAQPSDLPYAMATLTPGSGTWSFSGLEPGAYTIGNPVWIGGNWNVPVTSNADGEVYDAHGVNAAEDDLSVTFEVNEASIIFSATRPYANGATLLDRASNVVSVSAPSTLVLPAQIDATHLRDFLVRLTVSASSMVTWHDDAGNVPTWDAMGAPPSSFAASATPYLYRFTEVAAGVWHCEDMLALAGKIPMYPMVAVAPSSGTLTVSPYTVATYTAGTSAESFEVAVGAGTAGTARDCELVIDCTAAGALAPTVTWPATFHPRTDAGTDFACEAGVRNVYYISEYAPGEFAVGGWTETEGGNA